MPLVLPLGWLVLLWIGAGLDVTGGAAVVVLLTITTDCGIPAAAVIVGGETWRTGAGVLEGSIGTGGGGRRSLTRVELRGSRENRRSLAGVVLLLLLPVGPMVTETVVVTTTAPATVPLAADRTSPVPFASRTERTLK